MLSFVFWVDSKLFSKVTVLTSTQYTTTTTTLSGFTHTSANCNRLYSFTHCLHYYYSTCILNINKSFAEMYVSGIRKTFEEENLLHILQRVNLRNIPRFDATPCLLGKHLPANLQHCEAVAAPSRKKKRRHPHKSNV